MLENELGPDQKAILQSTIQRYTPVIRANSQEGLYVVSQIAASASRDLGIHPFRAMQDIFNTQNLPVRFVAIPVGSDINREGRAQMQGIQFPSNVADYDIRMPHSGDTPYPYWLWITVSREQEYRDLLERLEVTPEDNLARLSQTGMLFTRTGSDISKAANAQMN